ncbi:FAD/NAD(P)-binding protein [Candidatus Poribacteria bacterium]|nr:FAD/NAD(P)-binding protein [Candidatus Poribacteria bacterium]
MKNPFLPLPVKISKIKVETDDGRIKSFDLQFIDEEEAARFKYMPGQFIEVSVLGVGEAPMGIASSPVEEESLRITVTRIGSVTSALHDKLEGSIIGVRGPLGNHYPLDQFEGKDIIIIGGGFGFTTLRSLILYMIHSENRGRFGKVTVIYGAREPGLFLYKDELAEWEKRKDLDLILTIDKPAEGWKGRIGFVTDVLKDLSPPAENTYAVACGPPAMIRFCSKLLLDLGFPPERIITSLEMKMKCGVGLCGRCNVGNLYVCKDGPIFTFKQLQEAREAVSK